MSSILRESWPSEEIEPSAIIIAARPSELVPDGGDEDQIEAATFLLRGLGVDVETVELPVNETHKFKD